MQNSPSILGEMRDATRWETHAASGSPRRESTLAGLSAVCGLSPVALRTLGSTLSYGSMCDRFPWLLSAASRGRGREALLAPGTRDTQWPACDQAPVMRHRPEPVR